MPSPSENPSSFSSPACAAAANEPRNTPGMMPRSKPSRSWELFRTSISNSAEGPLKVRLFSVTGAKEPCDQPRCAKSELLLCAASEHRHDVTRRPTVDQPQIGDPLARGRQQAAIGGLSGNRKHQARQQRPEIAVGREHEQPAGAAASE